MQMIGRFLFLEAAQTLVCISAAIMPGRPIPSRQPGQVGPQRAMVESSDSTIATACSSNQGELLALLLFLGYWKMSSAYKMLIRTL